MLKKVAAVTFSVVFIAASALPANNAEQVIFSTPGFVMSLQGNNKAGTTPFGFWVWCAADASANSKGGYQNDNACQGSMYFYALDKHASHVIGFSTEGPGGIYTMTLFQGTAAQLFAGTLNPAYVCTLVNDTPDPKGPSNGVSASCAFLDPSLGGGIGTADVTNAVANVTGP